MDRNELQRLAKAYLNGKATTDEKELLHQWYDTIHNGAQPETVYIEISGTEAGIKQDILEKILEKIENEKHVQEKKYRNAGIIKKIAVGIASAAALVFIVAGVIRYFKAAGIETNTERVGMVNFTAKMITKITLSDGSMVWLSAHTVFKYPNHFSGKVRGVELVEGRAFFDVRHINGYPFLVKTKSLNITVLGTSFDVLTNKKEGTTKVSVITGKVGITRPGHYNEPAVMILPKQQVILDKATSKLTKEVTTEPVVNLWCKSPLVFDQENLDNVFKAIEKQYNTHIEVANKKLLDERISITLSNQRLDTIMSILSFTKNFKYQIANDSTVVIK